ncbi:hypothetical protein LZ31DRAFT_601316 [Colletotrichum somersetense]|nr:hypothetical protein LZ31DRAFT_601316 [Colletotrichum somersetense]
MGNRLHEKGPFHGREKNLLTGPVSYGCEKGPLIGPDSYGQGDAPIRTTPLYQFATPPY